MTTTPAQSRIYDESSVGSLEFWAKSPDEREKVFRVLRDERPISWHRPAEGGLMPQTEGGGFWAVVRHADIAYVSRNPDLFSSAQGTMFEDMPLEMIETTQSFLGMDAPKHTRVRKLVSAAFTPKRVSRLEEQINAQAVKIVDELIETGSGGDFVDVVSRKLPMWTIFEMMGLAPEFREELAHAADAGVSWSDDDARKGLEPAEFVQNAINTMITTGMRLAAERREHPADDLMTNLVEAKVDGQSLTDAEIGAFVVLLSVAGNDTTRNTISLAMRALTMHPEQRKLLVDDFSGRIGHALEEFVRWVSPVQTFRRTATRDTELNGQHIAAGDKVVMFYGSANRDDRVFDDPYRFDITRDPNPHMGFGGGGVHFCLGNGLAKTQMRAIFGQLLTRVPELEVEEPVQLVSNFVNAAKSMRYHFSQST